MNKDTVVAHRLVRQGLIEPAGDEQAYVDLLRLLQPVAPVHFTKPGSPPRLVHRSTFDDGLFNDGLRGRRTLVKGRFLGGNIGYVLAEDLALYGTVFRREVARVGEEQERILQALRFTGLLTPRQLAEETGLTNKKLMPLLHRLQQAFLVYEAQEDSSWERGWSLFETEWPDVDFAELTWEEAAGRVLGRFLESHVFATFTQLRDWSKLPIRTLREVAAELETKGVWVSCRVEGLGDGWARAADPELAAEVLCVHVAQVRCPGEISRVAAQGAVRRSRGVAYLLIDGEFAGAVSGHWRIGPHDVEDIVVDLPGAVAQERQQEIVAAVSEIYHPPHSEIRRYAGESIE